MEKSKGLPGEEVLPTEEEKSCKEEEPVEFFCGIGKFRPKFLQIFRDAKFFTFLLSLNCFVEGALASGFISVVLSSIGLRYQIGAIEAGVIVSLFEIGAVVSVIFISYFAGKGHKPRWLGVGLLIQGTGALIFALPEFVFGEYKIGGSLPTLESCLDGINYPNCELILGEPHDALAFFYIGNILIGVGAAALFTVGPSYIDDIVRPKYVPIHLGMFFMWTILGPALGFGLGAGFLSVYVDFWRETDLEPSNPAWVGAWWLCYLLGAVVSWLLAIPFLMFPKLLPNSHLVKAEREKEMAKAYHRDVSMESDNFLTHVKSLPHHMLQVIKTPSWVFITLAISFLAFLVSGLTTFGPQFYVTQYSLTTSLASLTAAAVAIPAGVAGVLAGALILYFTKSKGRTVALINWIVMLLALPTPFIFLAYCPSTELVGVNKRFADGSIDESDGGSPQSSCNLQCNCTSPIYEPICGADGYTHYSPCIAGCDKAFNDRNRPVFENCTCIMENLMNMSTEMLSDEELMAMSTATGGECDNGCVNFGIFLTASAFVLFLFSTVRVPSIVVTIRCVADEHRALALGMQAFAFRVIGSSSGPLIFGFIFEFACLNFFCPSTFFGNFCWVYDNFQLSWSILLVTMVVVIAYFVFSFLTWFVYPKQKVSDELTFSPMQVGATNQLGVPEGAIAVNNPITELNVLSVPKNGMDPEDGIATEHF